jgi:hypothetical protein
LDRAVNVLNTELNENLQQLGPVSSSPTEPRLHVNIGIKIIKDNIIDALRYYFSNYESAPWAPIRARYPWFAQMYNVGHRSILTDMGDQRAVYSTYLLNTLIEIILNGSLIAPCQFHTGQGFTTRIAEEHRAVVDPATGRPYNVMRWDTSREPALWVHTEAHSSESYPKKSGTSVALYRTLSNKSTKITPGAPGSLMPPVIERTALLFLNLNHLDYDDADNLTWTANANMINQLVTLVRYRLGNWNLNAANLDPLLDDNLQRGPGDALVTTRIGRWMMEQEHQLSLNISLDNAYTSDIGNPNEGRRNSTYTDDKLLHYPLVDFLQIFSDMINYCIQNPPQGNRDFYTALQDSLPQAEINRIFPQGFNIDIIGTFASYFWSHVSGFSSEAILNQQAFALNKGIFRPTTGVVAYHTGNVHAPYLYKSISGGSRKRNSKRVPNPNLELDYDEISLVTSYDKYVKRYYSSSHVDDLVNYLVNYLIRINLTNKYNRKTKKGKTKHKGGYKLTSKKRTRRHSRKRYY